jgi:MerR family transcriptional regulator, light-induced transcriptional regulator
LPRTLQLAIPLASGPTEAVGIGAAERETGLSKDTLRIWERRYGFPQPGRDANGERIYPAEQVEKLRLIRRLMERGLRPGKIVTLDLNALESLGPQSAPSAQGRKDLALFLDLLRDHNVAEFRRQLAQALMRQGLRHFVLDTVVPLNDRVRDSWMSGELELFEEHLYAEQIQGTLRSAIHSIQNEGRTPRVLLATFTSESRALLVMEALCCVEGTICFALGPDTPCREIARAATAHEADIVGLAFSTFSQDVVTGLSELRALIPRGIAVWASGNHLTRTKKPPHGIEVLYEMNRVPALLQQWRSNRGL